MVRLRYVYVSTLIIINKSHSVCDVIELLIVMYDVTSAKVISVDDSRPRQFQFHYQWVEVKALITINATKLAI